MLNFIIFYFLNVTKIISNLNAVHLCIKVARKTENIKQGRKI